MEVDQGHHKLRLAARTLIEWKVPISSPEYKRVFSALMAIHPLSKELGSLNLAQLHLIDDQGTILWFLSERTNQRIPTATLSIEADYPMQVTLEDRLIVYSVSDLKQTRVWLNGPTRSRVVGIILAALHQRSESKRRVGFDALLSILVPLDAEEQKQRIGILIENVSVVSTTLERLNAIVRNSYSASRLISVAVIIVQTFYGLFTLVSVKSLLEKLSIERWLEILIAVGPLPFAFFWLYKGKSVFMRANLRIVKDRRTTNEENAELVWTPELHIRIGKICGDNSAIMVSLLRSQADARWAYLALRNTRVATTDVVRSVLNVIRDPDIPNDLQDSIFLWLCKVRIFDPKSRYHGSISLNDL